MATGEVVTDILELHNGDHMSQAEFHRIYSEMPEDFRAELIGGIVYVASPLKRSHGTPHVFLSTLLGTYALETPGTEPGDNTTLILGEDSEPQPDLYLRVLPEFGGQSTTDDEDYVVGAPELVVEVANTSRTIDLHRKLDDYAKYGVLEYVVVSTRDERLFWFDLASGESSESTDGIVRVRSFPGLWIDVAAVLSGSPRMMDALRQGLASAEHAEFVKRLASRRATDD